METILVVEDDLAVQKALRRLFESEDYAVDVKPDGQAGLDAFHSSRPAAVVLDLRLPGLPGHDVCREIKKRAPSLPIIVLSAKTDVADKVLLLEMGADDYVTKPFSPRELLARVRAALRRTQRTEPTDQYVFGEIAVNFAKMELTWPPRRKCGRVFRSASAATSSEGGIPGRMVRSQEPKEPQTSVGKVEERYCRIPCATMPAWTKRW